MLAKRYRFNAWLPLVLSAAQLIRLCVTFSVKGGSFFPQGITEHVKNYISMQTARMSLVKTHESEIIIGVLSIRKNESKKMNELTIFLGVSINISSKLDKNGFETSSLPSLSSFSLVPSALSFQVFLNDRNNAPKLKQQTSPRTLFPFPADVWRRGSNCPREAFKYARHFLLHYAVLY